MNAGDARQRGERESLVRPAEEMRNQDQVTRARDRQEFGEPLHDGEDDGLNWIHGYLQRVTEIAHGESAQGRIVTLRERDDPETLAHLTRKCEQHRLA